MGLSPLGSMGTVLKLFGPSFRGTHLSPKAETRSGQGRDTLQKPCLTLSPLTYGLDCRTSCTQLIAHSRDERLGVAAGLWAWQLR